jgi:hypothetical protein
MDNKNMSKYQLLELMRILGNLAKIFKNYP